MRIKATLIIALSVLAANAQTQTATGTQTVKVTRSGSVPSRQAPAENFTGTARIDSPFQGTAAAARPANATVTMHGARVTFEAGARTAWHTHPLGQTLIVISGTGRVQAWNQPAQDIGQGDTVWIPPGQKHWHGAAPDAAMTHIAIVEQLDGKSTDWMEKVTDAQYAAVSPDRKNTSKAAQN